MNALVQQVDEIVKKENSDGERVETNGADGRRTGQESADESEEHEKEGEVERNMNHFIQLEVTDDRVDG